jgi:hypothetical protein
MTAADTTAWNNQPWHATPDTTIPAARLAPLDPDDIRAAAQRTRADLGTLLPGHDAWAAVLEHLADHLAGGGHLPTDIEALIGDCIDAALGEGE